MIVCHLFVYGGILCFIYQKMRKTFHYELTSVFFVIRMYEIIKYTDTGKKDKVIHMKYVKQFGIILFISFLGEVLYYIIPLPIPASIYGIILMFVGLGTGLVPYESVRETGHFLVEIMPLMFIPAAVGLVSSWELLKSSWLAYVAVTAFTTVIVMAVSGLVTQMMIGAKQKKMMKSVQQDSEKGADIYE